MHYFDTELYFFVFAVILLAAAGWADYYSHHRYTSDDHFIYQHTITSTYVKYHIDASVEYHVIYITQIVSSPSFFDDDSSSGADSCPATDAIVPEPIYRQLYLGMVINSTTEQIDWSDIFT